MNNSTHSRFFIIAILFLVIAVSLFVFTRNSDNSKQGENPPRVTLGEMSAQEIRDDSLGIIFAFPDGDDGYVVSDIPDTALSGDEYFVGGYQLMLARDYNELQYATEPREGPPTIDIRVYQNPEQLSPHAWAEQNPRESLIEFAFDTPVEAVVAGANAVRYTASGLYGMHMYVVTHKDLVYLMSAGFIDETTMHPAVFVDILAGVEFVAVVDSE